MMTPESDVSKSCFLRGLRELKWVLEIVDIWDVYLLQKTLHYRRQSASVTKGTTHDVAMAQPTGTKRLCRHTRDDDAATRDG